MRTNDFKTVKNRCRKSVRGYALTELLLVLGIIALVLGAIAAIAVTTSAGQTAQNESRLIDSAANKIRTIYSSQPDFAGLDNTVSTQIEAWPTSMVSGPAAIFNSWGGAINVVSPATAVSGQVASRLFSIDSENVSQDSCADLATASTTALGISVAGTPVYERGVPALDPVDTAGAAAVCVEGVTIMFTYGKNG